MKKLFGIVLVLALVLSFSLVATTPVGADPGHVLNIDTGKDFGTIQEAIDDSETLDGHTIEVAAGEYAGANVNKGVAIVGAVGGGSVITSGVHYGGGAALDTAFLLDVGADGAEIRNFTVECDSLDDFSLGIFSRGIDGVIVDSLTVNNPVQGISNWGGSNWEITNNQINYTEASGGGGIGIFVGAMPPDYRMASGNLVAGNSIIATATAEAYSTPGIALSLDLRYGRYDHLDGNEQLHGNRVLNNTIIGNGGHNSQGIQIGVIGVTDDPVKIAATMGIIDDTDVQGNVIEDVYTGLYFFVARNLTVIDNEMTGCSNNGMATFSIEDALVEDNTFTSNDRQVRDYSDDFDLVEATLVDNTFDRAVVVRGSDSDIKVPIIFSTIEDALDAAGPGDTIEVKAGTYVGYDPLLDAEIAEATISIGEDASASTTSVSAEATGGDDDTIVAVAEFVGNPSGVSPGFRSGAVYIDVHVGGTLPEELVVEIACPGSCSGVELQWWDGTEWQAVVVQEIDGGIVRATLNNVDSSPLISELTGTPFGLGSLSTVGWEGSSVDKVAVVAPWIALMAAMMAGAALLGVRRRRAQI